ncbi:Detected protein of confused Function [Hibiscus syriacus]|uniref:Detected protein of confused Function n=1 Tax=Hibiscus syriacus TaxID=106335 RepID=A0A6A2YJT2_HIBSY|nr:Detected protein of confused Function [Hibiscus syriacus]
MADRASYSLAPQLDIEQILQEAQRRWLRPAEICEILRNYQKFQITSEAPNRPPSMNIESISRLGALICCTATMPMEKRMKTFKGAAIGCLNRMASSITSLTSSCEDADSEDSHHASSRFHTSSQIGNATVMNKLDHAYLNHYSPHPFQGPGAYMPVYTDASSNASLTSSQPDTISIILQQETTMKGKLLAVESAGEEFGNLLPTQPHWQFPLADNDFELSKWPMDPSSNFDLPYDTKLFEQNAHDFHLSNALEEFSGRDVLKLGEVDDLQMQSSSGIAWSAVECGNVSDDASLSPSLSHDQLFSIIDFSPKWAYIDLETKVLIIGTYLRSREEVAKYNWSCMFGEVEVPAEVIADGILSCHAPPHSVGQVPFYVTCSNRLACSEVREFDYRSGFTKDINILDIYDVVSREMLMRFQSLLSLKSLSHPKHHSEGCLQKLMKEKLYSWLLHKIVEDGKGPTVLDEKGQGVLHLAAALGYDWAIEPTVTAGVSVNFRDANGWTALHWAAFCGRQGPLNLEQTVAILVSLGADPGALTDPTPEFPLSRTPADLASCNGHKGISGYLAESSLTGLLSSLKMNDQKEAVQIVSERMATPVYDSDLQDLSLKDSITAVCNATQAADRIYQMFRMRSFQRKQLTESGDGVSDEHAISLIAAKARRPFQVDRVAHAAATQIQKKFRGALDLFSPLSSPVVRHSRPPTAAAVRRHFPTTVLTPVFPGMITGPRRFPSSVLITAAPLDTAPSPDQNPISKYLTMAPQPPSQLRNPRRVAASSVVAASSHSTVPPSTSRFSPLPHEPYFLGAFGDISLDSAKELEARVKELRTQEKRAMETTKTRKRHRRVFTRRLLVGLRHYVNFPLPPNSAMNDVLAALAREAGWTVEPDGTTYRQSPSPKNQQNLGTHTVKLGGKHKVRKISAVQAIPAFPIADIDLVGTKESTTIGYSNEKFFEISRRKRKGVHNSSKEDQPRIGYGFIKGCFTIFIENLPESINWKRLGSIFGIHGQVIDAFIPKKTNSKAFRFGFICYATIEEARITISKMNGNHIYGSKARVSLAKYKPRQSYWRKSSTGVHLKSGTEDISRNKLFEVEGVVDEDKLHVLSNCLVGWCKNFIKIGNLAKQIQAKGLAGFTLMRAAGNVSLVVECRRVWLVCEGIPFHAWNWNTFKNIATKWGNLVAIDNSCEFPSSFDRARIQILTKAQGRIDELMELKVGENLFKIMVHEVDPSFKPNSWVPEDCDISLELVPSVGS